MTILVSIPTESMSHLGEHSVLLLESHHQLRSRPSLHNIGPLQDSPSKIYESNLGSWPLCISCPQTCDNWSLSFCSPFHVGVYLDLPVLSFLILIRYNTSNTDNTFCPKIKQYQYDLNSPPPPCFIFHNLCDCFWTQLQKSLSKTKYIHILLIVDSW